MKQLKVFDGGAAPFIYFDGEHVMSAAVADALADRPLAEHCVAAHL